MKNTTFITMLLSSFFFCQFSIASPIIAVNPIKPEIALFGENRAIYIIDKETFKVVKRISKKHKLNPFNELFTYNSDGSKLIIDFFSEGVHFLETENYTSTKSFKLSGTSTISNDKSVLASFDDGTVKIYDSKSGNQTSSFKVEVNEDDDMQGFNISNDNKSLLFWFEKKKSEEEKINYTYDELKDLSSKDQRVKKLKNDGESSYYFTVEISSHKKSAVTETWVSNLREVVLHSYNGGIVVVDGCVFFFNAKGELTVPEVETSSSSEGSFIDYDSKTLFEINSDFVNIVNLENLSVQSNELDLWMIYVSHARYHDGWLYFVTDHYRLAGINKNGGMKEYTHIF